MRLLLFLLFSINCTSTFAGKTLAERIEICLDLHAKTVEDAQALATNVYSLQKEMKTPEAAPYEIVEKDVNRLKKGIQQLDKKTEKTLNRYNYYTEELEFEVEDVFIALDQSTTFLKRGIKSLDEAAFENYTQHLNNAHQHFLSSLEHLILYRERLIALKEILYKMMSKRQITF
jgi:uncharacterized protein YaaN involved in tellurite resistance